MAWPPFFVLGVSSAGMAYVYYGVMRLPRGLTRLAATAPLIAFYVYMPLGFDTVFERALYSFFFTWLTSFKLALLCWDAGPAADPWAVASFPRFVAVMNLSLHLKREQFSQRAKGYSAKPILTPPGGEKNSDASPSAARQRVLNGENHVKAPLAETRKNPKRNHWTEIFWVLDESLEWHMVVVRLAIKFVLLGLISSSYSYRASMPLGLLYFIYCWHLYVVCSLMFEGLAAAVSPVLGIELEPAYDKPFLAHSLTDFWGKRWNLLISDLLRVSVYDPMLHLCLRSGGRSRPVRSNGTGIASGVHNGANGSVGAHGQPEEKAVKYLSAGRPPLWARSISMFSCFLVSGLMHELIFYYMNRTKPTWEGTAFFAVNGAAALVELAVRRKTRLRLPKSVSTPLTLAFLFFTAIWLFYPALCGPGTADVAIAEFQYFFQKVNLLFGS